MKKSWLCLALCAAALVGCGETSTPSETSQEPIPGPKGDKGDNGSSVLTGEGAPSDSLGTDGDSYIDLSTFDFYVKAEGTWSKEGNIKGAAGEDGFDGKTGLNGKDGKDGKDGLSFLSGSGAPTNTLGVDGDLYVDTATFDVYKKADGEWSKTGNIKGDKGDKGEDAINYYPNTFLPSVGGYIYSDKGSYALGDTIKIHSKADTNYELKAIEVTYNDVKSVYASSTGLDDLLANGLPAKEAGYIFKPIFVNPNNAYSAADFSTIGTSGDGTYSLEGSSYGTQENGIAVTATGGIITLEGKVDEAGKPATTVYLSGKSTFNADYLFLKNFNFVLADDYADTTSLLEFNGTFADFSNCKITIDKETKAALKFTTGNFGIKDVEIHSEASADKNVAYLTTAVLFGENEADKFSRVVVDNLIVNNVKKTQSGVYAGSVFKSYWDTPYFTFEIKNSTFGTADTKIGELWTHFRQKDYISVGDRWGYNYDKTLYKKYQKTSSVKLINTDVYCDLVWQDWGYNVALITFRVMQNTSDSTGGKGIFADILIEVNNSRLNGNTFTKDGIQYFTKGSFPFTTLYIFDDDDGWHGVSQLYYYDCIYPYATVDGEDATLVRGQYPSLD